MKMPGETYTKFGHKGKTSLQPIVMIIHCMRIWRARSSLCSPVVSRFKDSRCKEHPRSGRPVLCTHGYKEHRVYGTV